jgi:hypothetical protein
MILKCNGSIGVGTTNPTGMLEISKINSGTVGPILFLRNNTATATGNATQISFAGNSGGDATSPTAKIVSTETCTAAATLEFYTYNGGPITEKMRITAAGNIGINCTTPSYRLHVNGTFYAAGSSQDYKQSICNYNTDSCMFMKLKPVTYQYKEEYCHLGKELKSGTQIGLIAEEVAESHPELAILVNEEDEKVVRNVDYEKLTIILLSELQKLRQEVDQLKNK